MNEKPKTPNCSMHEALVSFLYGEATPGENRQMEAHLAKCAGCKHELEAFEHVRGMLQQWQLDDLPVVRVVAQRPNERSALALLRELFSVTPLWVKALGAVATVMLVLAVIGADVKVGSGGVSFHADLLRRGRSVEPSTAQPATTPDGVGLEQVRGDVKALVNQLIADSDRRRKEEIKAQLVSLESQLQSAHSADLAKVVTRIQEQQQRLKTIQQDIDRREGLDLTDILFSEVVKPQRSTSGGGD